MFHFGKYFIAKILEKEMLNCKISKLEMLYFNSSKNSKCFIAAVFYCKYFLQQYKKYPNLEMFCCNNFKLNTIIAAVQN